MRSKHFEALNHGRQFDSIVIGGGVTGAPIYNALCKHGYRVALFDKGDFASGTSQASGMMVWGGLLYLKHMDLRTVKKLCAARDYLIQSAPEAVSKREFRFLTAQNGGQNPMLVMMGLYLYWLLGDSARAFPKWFSEYSEQILVKNNRVSASLMFEEAFLSHSDARYVLEWIRQFSSNDHVPLNHCAVTAGKFNSRDKLWYLYVRDELTGNEYEVRSKTVINCAGVWTDSLNSSLGIRSSHRHVMSKGVYINLKRASEHTTPLVFEMDGYDDVITYVPWGPVSMWGPTETAIDRIEDGCTPTVDDIRFLLSQMNANMKTPIGPEDIVSVRCGIRPLAVDKDYSKSEYPLELSRKYAIDHDRKQKALSVYGGKLTTSALLGDKILAELNGLEPSLKAASPLLLETPDRFDFPGVPDQVSPVWARDHEMCCTMEDYLRRRTNISQWIPRMGLGSGDEFKETLYEIASTFSETSGKPADHQLSNYTTYVITTYDDLLKSVETNKGA